MPYDQQLREKRAIAGKALKKAKNELKSFVIESQKSHLKVDYSWLSGFQFHIQISEEKKNYFNLDLFF